MSQAHGTTPSTRRDPDGPQQGGDDEHREMYGQLGGVAKIVALTTSVGVVIAVVVVILLAIF